MGTPLFSTDTQISEKQNLIREIQTLLLKKLSIRVESAEADLFEMGILDSVALVRLLVHLEEDFGCYIPMEDLGVDSYSIANIAELIASRKWTKPVAVGSPENSIGGGNNGGHDGSVTSRESDIAEQQNLTGEIQALFLNELYITVESVEADLFKEGVLDSQSLVQLIFSLEERFGLELPLKDLELDSLASVAKIADLIANRRQVKANELA